MTWLLLAPAIVVGMLSEQGSRVCQNGEQSWVDPRLEVGFQRVVFDTPPPKDLIGAPVIARGAPSAPPKRAPLPPDDLSCPPMQARSDWVIGMSGVRLRREDQPAKGHYRAPTAEKFTGLSATVGEAVEVTFHNTTGVALTGVKLRMHYEGCYGKPGAPDEAHPLGDLAVDAKARATFPVRIMRKIGRGEEHVPFSLQVVAQAPGLVMDLDQPVRLLGVDVPCESRKRGRKR